MSHMGLGRVKTPTAARVSSAISQAIRNPCEAHAMTPAPVAQPNAITKVAAAWRGQNEDWRCLRPEPHGGRFGGTPAGVYVGPQAFAVAGDIIEYAP
jgi:hypothetical protein